MKKYLLAILLTVAAVWLCACGETQETSADADAPQSAEGAEATGDSLTQTIHMYETLCDGLVIDADIPTSENLAFPTYQANYFVISAEDAVSVLAEGSEIKEKDLQYFDYDPNGFKVELDSGAEIYHDCGWLSYDSETEKQDREIADLLSRYGEKHSEEAVHELSFMTSDEAVSKAAALIGALDIIGEPELDTIVGLTGAEIMVWQSELMTDESYSEWVDIGKTIVLEDLTSENDAYYLSFYFTYQDIPVYNLIREPNVSFATDSIPPYEMTASVLITPKGVRYFQLKNALGAQGEESEAQSLISAQEALQKVCEKRENSIVFGIDFITEVWLEYIPIRDANAAEGVGPYTLKPYWCFGTGDANAGGEYITNAERINAITGDDLAYE